MGIVQPDSFDTGIRNGSVAPVYFLFGDEEFLIEEALERLLAATVDESTRSFNFDQFHGSETGLRDVVERAESYPMMAERRVVVLRDLERAIGSRKGDDGSGFLAYLKSPLDTTTLILTASNANFLGRGKAKPKAPYNDIIEAAVSVNYKKVYDRELPNWVNARINAKRKKISPEAVALLVGYVGASLRTLHNEIEKLFTFVEDRTEIGVDDVRAVVGASKTWNVFELQKTIGERKLENAVEIAERMLRAGEPPQLIITMVTRYFTILWRLLEVRTRHRDQKAAAREVGISPFFISEYFAALNRYSLHAIGNAFESLLSADIALKSSRIAPSLIMQLTLISIIQGRNLVTID